MKNKNCIHRIRKHFPGVNKVVDAKESINVTVTNADVRAANKKDQTGCAMAKACLRRPGVDGAIIQISKSYIIKGDTAIRYTTSEAVAREITSFDRGASFEEGQNYKLSKVSKSNRLDARPERERQQRAPHTTEAPKPTVHNHRTDNIRVTKG